MSTAVRVILVGRTGLDQSLRLDRDLEIIRARVALDAVGELGDPIEPGRARRSVVVVAPDAEPAGPARDEFIEALRLVDPHTTVLRTGTAGRPYDGAVHPDADGTALRRLLNAVAPALPVEVEAPETPELADDADDDLDLDAMAEDIAGELAEEPLDDDDDGVPASNPLDVFASIGTRRPRAADDDIRSAGPIEPAELTPDELAMLRGNLIHPEDHVEDHTDEHEGNEDDDFTLALESEDDTAPTPTDQNPWASSAPDASDTPEPSAPRTDWRPRPTREHDIPDLAPSKSPAARAPALELETTLVRALLAGEAVDTQRLASVLTDRDPSLHFAVSKPDAAHTHVIGSESNPRGWLWRDGDSAPDHEAAWITAWLRLAERQTAMRTAAFIDPLTGAHNRRYFHGYLRGAIERARREQLTVSLFVFDIDHFKSYNDRHGHAAGDEILTETVKLLRSVIRPTDRVCRIGGDEFAVVFFAPEGPRQAGSTPPDSAGLLARRCQKAICAHRFPKLGRDAVGTLTISAGLASFPWDGDTPDALLERADKLSLASKRAGKNAITLGSGAERHCNGD